MSRTFLSGLVALTLSVAPSSGFAQGRVHAHGLAPDTTVDGERLIASGLAYPFGRETFDRLNTGESVESIEGWVVEGGVAVGARAASGTTGQDLRVVDIDAGAGANVVCTPVLESPEACGYRWTLRLQLESLPPAGATGAPALAIQHARTDGAGFDELFGVELTSAGGTLFARRADGTRVTAPLFMLGRQASIGPWIE